MNPLPNVSITWKGGAAGGLRPHRMLSTRMPKPRASTEDDKNKGSSGAHQARWFRLSPREESRLLQAADKGRLHKQVSLAELASLLWLEKRALSGALAGIVLASACAMVTPTIFGNVVSSRRTFRRHPPPPCLVGHKKHDMTSKDSVSAT
jgi:hypothetical protein